MGCCVSCYTGGAAVSYESIKSELKTGDAVLCHGKGSCFSCSIQTCSNSPWSHVGMIVRCEHFEGDPDNLYIWHSDKNSVPDILTKRKKKSGPQLSPFGDYLAHYGGDIAVRQLVGQATQQMDPTCDDWLHNWMQQHKRKSYEKNPFDLFTSLFRCCRSRKGDASSYFCSELLADTYMGMGLLEDNWPADMYTPADFSSAGIAKLKSGLYLGPEVLILPPGEVIRKGEYTRLT